MLCFYNIFLLSVLFICCIYFYLILFRIFLKLVETNMSDMNNIDLAYLELEEEKNQNSL